MKCLLCRSDISVDGNSTLFGATEFRSVGNAMSLVTRDRDGSVYLINVCDSCMGKALDDGRAVRSNKWK